MGKGISTALNVGEGSSHCCGHDEKHTFVAATSVSTSPFWDFDDPPPLLFVALSSPVANRTGAVDEASFFIALPKLLSASAIAFMFFRRVSTASGQL